MAINIPKKNLAVIILDVFNNTVQPILKEEAESLANEFCQTLKDNIRTHDIQYQKVSPRTLRNKRIKNQPSTPLIATGQYLDNIVVRPTKGGFTVGVGKGIHASNHHSKEYGGGSVSLRRLARWLEFGTATMPARPHCRPTWAAFLRKKEITKRHIAKRTREAGMKVMKKFNEERFRK